MHASLLTWWNSISLRTKITGVTVLLLTFGLAISGLGTMTVMRSFLFQEVDTQVKAAAAQVQKQLAEADDQSDFMDYWHASLSNYYLAIIDTDGGLFTDNSEKLGSLSTPDSSGVTLAWTEQNEGRTFTLESDDGESQWRTAAFPVTVDDEPHTLIVGVPLDSTNNAIARMFTLFLLFGIVVVALGAIITRLLVTGAFGPLRRVEKTAAAIAEGDFSQRLEGATPNTEVGRLNRSLNLMLNRIDKALNDRARTIDQMRRFVGDASHELRTPLVSLRGYAELYRMGALQSRDEVGQAMERIEKEAVRMSGLVADLLELARLDETKPLQLTEVDLLPLAKDAALDAMASSPGRVVSVVTDNDLEGESLGTDDIILGFEDEFGGPSEPLPDQPTASSTLPRTNLRRSIRNATVTGPIAFSRTQLARLRRRARERGPMQVVVVAPDTAPENARVRALVMGEENKIRQVLTNLLGNATRFTPIETPIEIVVRANAAKGTATLEVVDHGEGIPRQVREKIFQRFWRADSSRTRDTGGSGLGLAIVSAIVAAHRGSVEVDETPGGGATFRVRLPLFLPSDADATAAPTSA
ncbi:HAMP domain-containing sensor histidine kinase [Herbiconiux sp. L3-i23]|uniref:sensor histidine kinase n=1 Tax=Herbiconiux sp. L3-i23 TaxID=2905871 RepID=UPI002068BE9E|nr:HAMP domain-containing sensor histidine kinase [Herbiconiux sp. L3-i23]BDI23725.1 two-component sensor histidine kinase [Herbiconiux sp. L3-i23]